MVEAVLNACDLGGELTRYAKWILSLANQIRRVHNASTNNNGVQARVLYFVLDNYSERDIFQKDM